MAEAPQGIVMTRACLLACTVLATIGVGYPAFTAMPVKLIWNASASTPIGLYAISFGDPVKVTDLVAVAPSEPLATFLAKRGYLPKDVPLMKRVLAVAGQKVCRDDLVITLDGVEVGRAHRHDRSGRCLPVWQGCKRVKTGEVFLMNRQVSDSFDGRYFGLTSTGEIIGRAVPLWTDEHDDGRFQWRAPTR